MDDPWSLLRLQIEWGADEALEAEPLDRLRPAEAAPLAALAPGRAPAEGSVPSVVPPAAPAREPHPARAPAAEAPRGTPAERALAAAGAAGTLEELRAAIAAFDGCALRDTASHLVFAEGDRASQTLVVGEPPGRDEDRSGHPFAGAEGQLLDQMLASIGIQRAELMLTPLIPWRPPGERPASPAELALCLPFLHRLIGLLRPAHILLFGPNAARAVLQQNATRRRVTRGWVEVRVPDLSDPLPALVLPSLAEMLKTPATRRDAWTALRLFRRILDRSPTES